MHTHTHPILASAPDTIEKTRKSRRRYSTPGQEYLSALQQYIDEMRSHQSDRLLPVPDPALLTTGLVDWLPSFIGADVIRNNSGPDYVGLTFNKPNGAGPTQRFCDPEFLLVAILHVLQGGSFTMEPHGNGKEFFYWRIQVRGLRKRLGRAYALRLIVGTTEGWKTREYELHDLRRLSLGGRFPQSAESMQQAKLGRTEMIAWSIVSFEVSKSSKHFCATPDEYFTLMEEVYGWLEAVPLGYPSK